MFPGYLILKAIHVIGIISWMAGLLYLFRLYVYHRDERNKEVKERFCVMEYRLWMTITVPAAWVSAATGLLMVAWRGCALLAQGWFTAKLVLVVLMLVVHGVAGGLRRRFIQAPYPFSSRFLRILNEAPTLLMVGIVFLVILQPQWWLWSCAN